MEKLKVYMPDHKAWCMWQDEFIASIELRYRDFLARPYQTELENKLLDSIKIYSIFIRLTECIGEELEGTINNPSEFRSKAIELYNSN